MPMPTDLHQIRRIALQGEDPLDGNQDLTLTVGEIDKALENAGPASRAELLAIREQAVTAGGALGYAAIDVADFDQLEPAAQRFLVDADMRLMNNGQPTRLDVDALYHERQHALCAQLDELKELQRTTPESWDLDFGPTMLEVHDQLRQLKAVYQGVKEAVPPATTSDRLERARARIGQATSWFAAQISGNE